MFQTLQIVQIVLFVIPIAALIGVGMVILFRPISVINRRWMLLVFLPLLLANSVAIYASDTLTTAAILGDWRLWLIVIADVGLTVGIIVIFRGYTVVGLNAETTSQILADEFRKQGHDVDLTTGEKRLLGSGPQATQVLSVSQAEGGGVILIMAGAGDVVVRPGNRMGSRLVKSAIGALRAQEAPYEFRSHAIGALYLVLALVFAVMTWIFFFEPRLILIE